MIQMIYKSFLGPWAMLQTLTLGRSSGAEKESDIQDTVCSIVIIHTNTHDQWQAEN